MLFQLKKSNVILATCYTLGRRGALNPWKAGSHPETRRHTQLDDRELVLVAIFVTCGKKSRVKRLKQLH
jgi:hypothetical protein